MRVVFSTVSKRGFLFFLLVALSPLIMAGLTPFVCMLLEFDSFYFFLEWPWVSFLLLHYTFAFWRGLPWAELNAAQNNVMLPARMICPSHPLSLRTAILFCVGNVMSGIVEIWLQLIVTGILPPPPAHHTYSIKFSSMNLTNRNPVQPRSIFQANAGSIDAVVARLAKSPLPKGWPVALKLGCNVDGSSSAPAAGGGSDSSSSGGDSPKKKASTARKSASGSVRSKVRVHCV